MKSIACLSLLLVAALAPVIMPAAAASPDPPTITILDTLGAATPATKFSIFGSSGTSILPTQFVGPSFTLTQATVITEIGGFVNGDIPSPSNPTPFIVQIRPLVPGTPVASTVLASFVLSSDNNPLIVSYESVSTKLILKAGTYFALFGSQDDNEGFVLATANSPFAYLAGTTTFGVLNPTTGRFSTQGTAAAVRILGHVPNAADQLNALLDKVVSEALGPGASLAGKLKAALVALSVGNQNATRNILAAFVNEVRAQAGHSLTAEQATQLIAAADLIRSALTCQM
jgi:hypothetical protein